MESNSIDIHGRYVVADIGFRKPAENAQSLTNLEKDCFKELINLIESGSEEEFLRIYETKDGIKKYNNLQLNCLQSAIFFRKSKKILDAILINITDINGPSYIGSDIWTYQSNQIPLIDSVCASQNFYIFQLMTGDTRINASQLNNIARSVIELVVGETFELWFNQIYHKFDVNAIIDSEQTLLEKALMHENYTAIRYFLKHGAYIGLKSCFDSINHVEPHDFENLFDSCIDNFEDGINFNYRNLAPPKGQDDLNEMSAIMLLIDSKEHLPLLKHPLIQSYLAIKWKSIQKFLYINVFFYFVYLVSMIAHIVFMKEGFSPESVTVTLSWWLTTIGISYLIFREAVQFLLIYPKEYLRQPSTYMELLLIVLSIWIIQMTTFDRKEVIVSAIILMGVELWMLVGYLPILNISQHMLMLKEVLKTFLRSFALYSIFVFMFALSFFVFFGSEKNKFGNIFTSVVKTMAMLVGELDLENLKFNNNVFGYLMFLMFAVTMTVVLNNLLSGLAVSDIQVVRDCAELNGLICRTKFLSKHDSKLFLQQPPENCFCFTDIFSIQVENKKIPNKVVFKNRSCSCTKQRKKTSKKLNCIGFIQEKYDKHVRHLCIGNNITMDSSIVKAAKKIIHHKKSQQREETERENKKESTKNVEHGAPSIEKIVENLEDRIQSIEKKVDKLLLLLETK